MTTAERTRQIYDRHPYPAANLAEIARKGRAIPPLQWLQDIGRPGRPRPERVLVAGCGTGAEAFVMRRRLPKAEIVAVDFSPRSVALARRLQRTIGVGEPITFLVADLTAPDLARQTGGNFDLITCHGVLSYLPDPELVLTGFAACLRPGGALYLGVNGEAHPATRLRPWLASFGFATHELRNERRLRELLGLWDSLHDAESGGFARKSTSYLAGDVCGPHFNNWPLSRWRAAANRCGWELAGTTLLPLALRLTTDGEHHRLLFPAGIGELAEHLDLTRPASFHKLLLRRAAPGALDIFPADGRAVPLRWSGLYSVHFSRTKDSHKVPATFHCPTFHLRLDWSLTRRQAEALRTFVETGTTSPSWVRHWGHSAAARRILWLWAGLGVVTPDDLSRAEPVRLSPFRAPPGPGNLEIRDRSTGASDASTS